MGVIRDPNDLFFTGYIEDDLGLPENDQIEDDVMICSVSDLRSSSKTKSRSSHNKKKGFDENLLLSKHRTGVRRARRTENLQYLVNMVDKEECECDMVSLKEPHVSAFAQLFMDHEKMKIWNDFVNGNGGRKKKDQMDREIVEEEEWEEIPDKRVVHPAFTAEESFRRLHSSFKKLLRRRHIPLGLLEKLEDEIITFFRDWPNSVFISEITCGFERLLLHHLCHFLCLHSSSKYTSQTKIIFFYGKH
ncbi:R3H domain-containing protein 4 [Patella vulgata]|uniref:R3H domain-containing protein 4 n=1 Tax=Patella vulgata TaxID=6465 RepID=UPI0021806F1A|nr:R3H domain-containing protein 4 [Patella vulgata]